jgi:hypothetical protein
LITGGYETESDVFVQDFFSNEVVIDLDMLGPSMVDGIRGESHGPEVVTPNGRRSSERKMEVSK